MSKVKSSSKKLKLPFKREFSAGGCVYKKIQESRIKNKESVVWLVGKHSGYHKWVLPKGLIEKGEKGVETAVRETKEEMGVEARVVVKKPIYKEQYWFVATLGGKKQDTKNPTSFLAELRGAGKKKGKKPIRRVKVYQEDPGFEESGEEKIKIFKTVSFYLMEYVSGEPGDHGWEMSDAGWYVYEKVMDMLAFDGEKEALRKAVETVGKI